MIMKYASDFRKTARDALRGKWGVAVLTGFVASLIGATIGTGGGGSSNNSSNDALKDLIPPEVLERILPALLLVLAILVIWCIVILVIGGAGKLGYAEFNLNLIDGNQAELSDLFLVPYQEAARAAFYREVSGASVPPFDPVPQEYPNVDD